jgi:ATP-dependent protease ClpP protease subunit
MPKHAYRFRGSIQPSAEVKRPVRAELTGEVDSAGAKLYLYDVIDSWGGDWGVSAREFNAALSELSGVSQITLHINSPGGEVYEGVAILNALRRHPANVTAVVDGIAASAASFIAAGSDRVVMGRNAEMMIHDAWGIAMGPAADMHAMGDQLDKVSNNIASIYAGKNGRDATAMRELMLAETWLSDQEAVDLGPGRRDRGRPARPGHHRERLRPVGLQECGPHARPGAEPVPRRRAGRAGRRWGRCARPPPAAEPQPIEPRAQARARRNPLGRTKHAHSDGAA